MTQPPLARVAVIVVAAGDGARLGADEPKAFVDLGGRPILVHALESVFNMGEPAQVIVVVPPARLSVARRMVFDVAQAAAAYTSVVAGGTSRQASVAAGLGELHAGVETVLVHDAARALAPTALFERVCAEVDARRTGVVPGLAVSDTIKTVDDAGAVVGTVDRSRLQAVQTPQAFLRSELVAAYQEANVVLATEFTDDAALMSAAGYRASVVAGDPLAFKITTPWDLRRAEQLLRTSPTAGTAILPVVRTGLGIDAHRFDESAPLWLAGLFWPHEPGLAGHSDGDVACHALCDALLSAAGLGDIGSNFCVDDPGLENAHGEAFLVPTLQLVHAAGFRVGNASVQIIGNRPRLAGRRGEAEARLSGILNAPVSCSATTTDGLGFTGRGEGLTAIATALLHHAGTGAA